MTNSSSLHSQFKQALENGSHLDLDCFKDQEFIGELQADEKSSLAKLFLMKGEQLLFEHARQGLDSLDKRVEEAFTFAEAIAPHPAEILCRQAACLFRLGRLLSEEHFLQLALKKFQSAYQTDPIFFENHLEYLHLFASTHVALWKQNEEESYLSAALSLFEKAALFLEKNGAENQALYDLYWDWGMAWIMLGKSSGESRDFQEGIAKFAKAEKLGLAMPHFQIDYGQAFYEFALLKGSPELLDAAITLFKKALLVTTQKDSPMHAAHVKGWTYFCRAMKKKAEYTLTAADVEAAEKVYQEAIISLPDHPQLWAGWGEMLLRYGWSKRHLPSIETALEKLTSSKIKECNPLHIATLIGEGLVILGLFLDDLKMIKDGVSRVEETFAMAPDYEEAAFAVALGSLAKAIYFDDERAFSSSVEQFEKAIRNYPHLPHLWQGLFQAFFTWGTFKKHESILKKALRPLERLTQLSPFCSHHWNQWGLLLMRLAALSEERETLLTEAIQKFQLAAEIEPENPELEWNFHLATAYDGLGDCTGDESDYEKAIEIFSMLLEKVPAAADVRYSLAIALSHLGELASDAEPLYKAVDLFESIDKAGEDDDTQACDFGYALLNLSTLVQDSLHPEEGEQLMVRAEAKLIRSAQLGNTDVYYHLACLYSLTGRFEAAVEYLQSAEFAGMHLTLDDLENDDWLANLRQTDVYQDYLATRNPDEGGYQRD